jgi:predicted Zn-dependent protease
MRISLCALALAATISMCGPSGVLAKEVSERIYLMPVGKVDREILAALKDKIPKSLPISSAVVIEKQRELPADAYDRSRDRYDARKLIEAVSASFRLAVTKERAVIITDADLSLPGDIEELSFADPKSGFCAVSLRRFKGAGPLRERALRETVRALGISLGLGECDNPKCVMHRAPEKVGEDRRRETFCYKCRIALERKASGDTVLGKMIDKMK